MKICPIMSHCKKYIDNVYCEEEECGLYDKEQEQCSIVTIARNAEKSAAAAETIAQCSDGAVMRIGNTY